MKTTIRLTLFSFLFCLSAKNTQAQMDTLFTDTVLIEIPFQQMVDSCFENVDLDLVPTGLLLEHGYPTIDVKAFGGTINDSNFAHTYSWRKAYGTLGKW
ncbi:MAG: hypothetical protein K1X81_14305 [Bacteroidia bacterium]|nr:hypothetical protein [Bacteroidia bacterium]